MAENEATKLFRLKDLKEYKVAKDEPDIRGWEVTGEDQSVLGVVHELIIDPELMKVRYLQVKLDKDLSVSKGDRYVLIPIGRAHLRRDERTVAVRSLNRSNVRFYPVYRGEAITRDYEYGLREALREDVDQNQHRQLYEDHNKYGEEYESIRGRYEDETNSEDPVVKMRAERDIARAERDILKAENEVLKMNLRNIRKAVDDDFYDHEHFNDQHFYGDQGEQKGEADNQQQESNEWKTELGEWKTTTGDRNRETGL